MLLAAHGGGGIGRAQGRIDFVRLRLQRAPALEQGRRAQRILQLLGECVRAMCGERQRRLAAAALNEVDAVINLAGASIAAERWTALTTRCA